MENNQNSSSAGNLAVLNNDIIQLVGENTCRTSPYYGIVSKFANDEELIGPVRGGYDGRELRFDFYSIKDGSLYKIFDGVELEDDSCAQDYDQYTEYPGDLSIIVDVNQCKLDIWKCNCCDHVLVELPYTEDDSSLDTDCTWTLCEGELCEYERLSENRYEVWHGIDATKYRHNKNAKQ